MDAVEDAYVDALLRALIRDLQEHPVPGALARVVIRWFEANDPLYLTIHALGAEQESGVLAGDEWYPLEWENVDEEMERVDRVLADSAVQATAPAVAKLYDDRDELVDGEWQAPPTLVEVARRAREAFIAAGIDVTDHMLLLVAHFEGEGALPVLRQINPPKSVIEALEQRDALPG